MDNQKRRNVVELVLHLICEDLDLCSDANDKGNGIRECPDDYASAQMAGFEDYVYLSMTGDYFYTRPNDDEINELYNVAVSYLIEAGRDEYVADLQNHE